MVFIKYDIKGSSMMTGLKLKRHTYYTDNDTDHSIRSTYASGVWHEEKEEQFMVLPIQVFLQPTTVVDH